MGKGEPACGGGEDEGGVEGGVGVEVAAEEEPEKEEESGGCKGDGEANGDFVVEAGAESGADHPIKERGFFKPWLAPEGGGDPIAGLGHVAADGGVAGLIGAEQADVSDGVEEEEVGGQRGCAGDEDSAGHLFKV